MHKKMASLGLTKVQWGIGRRPYAFYTSHVHRTPHKVGACYESTIGNSNELVFIPEMLLQTQMLNQLQAHEVLRSTSVGTFHNHFEVKTVDSQLYMVKNQGIRERQDTAQKIHRVLRKMLRLDSTWGTGISSATVS